MTGWGGTGKWCSWGPLARNFYRGLWAVATTPQCRTPAVNGRFA